MSSYFYATKRWRRTILTVVGALAFSYCCSQSLYNKTHKADRPAMVFSSIFKQDSLYYISGSTTDYSSPFTTKVCVAKLDSSGNFISYRSIKDGDGKYYSAFFNCLIKTAQGSFAFVGASYDSIPRALFGKFDDENTISTIEYQTPFSYAFNGEGIIEYDTNIFYIAGVRTDSSSLRSNVMLMKIDSTGNRMWEKYYGLNPVAESTTSFLKLNNGNLMIGSYRRDLNMTRERSYTWLLEVDTGGTMVRQWLDPNDSTYGAYGLKETKDGGFIYGAQKKIDEFSLAIYAIGTIVKMNSNFQKQWTYKGGGATEYTGIYDIEELEDGSFIGCGQAPFLQPDSTIQSGWVIKLSATGDLLWERGYEGFNTPLAYNFLYDIDVLPDGGFIACGEARGDSGQYGWILRLDSNGCEVENCIIGIDEVQNDEKGEVRIYPNPFTSGISIALKKEGISEATFTISNAMGQVVYHRKETNLAQGYTKNLDLSFLPNGIYFIEVSSPSNMQGGEPFREVKRVVKE